METITVGELKLMLDNYGDDDMPVVVAHDYGDRINTMGAIGLNECGDDYHLTPTVYSSSGWKINEGYDSNYEQVLVLNIDDM